MREPPSGPANGYWQRHSAKRGLAGQPGRVSRQALRAQRATASEDSVSIEREKFRGWLVHVLVYSVAAVSVGSLALLASGRITVQDLPSVVATASPLTGLAVSAVSFYLGGRELRTKR